jgi:hypothetical protein
VILPAGNNMQAALNTYEPPNGTINSVKDAAEQPQIFQPNASVTFKDIREGASFEDSFGWYNVGDDVSTAAGRTANLHPVMGCGVVMLAPGTTGAGDATHHIGDPTAYVLNAEEPNSITVNFTAERTAGRWKGGFIGFYLITPEGHASANGCGDFKTGTDGKSLFGFIYFTQKDLNNDGDFVHHLVYKSKVDKRFFFGFEDLFRGGDNDFEDMAMQIDGLSPPCVQSPEVCDGIDNDCDGLIDGNDPKMVGTGDVCTCDGTGPCDNGPKAGQCQSGVTVCTAGAITCHATGTPSPETCDGIDNDCDGHIDNNPSGTGAACDGQDADLCKEGQIVCQGGKLVCNDNTPSNVEICNGLDDDCNGTVDDGDPGGGGQCGSSIGVCTPGTLHCRAGHVVCEGGNTGGPELCNGLDDDCNGVIDDAPTDVGQPCGPSNVGECKFGQTICTNGALSCAGQVGPGAEICNGKDDDCNGTVDDHLVDTGQPCGSSTGVCTPGTFQCVGGNLACQGGNQGGPEQCNGLDDDCNGIIDDNVVGEGTPCTNGPLTCNNGVNRCISGAMVCVGGTTGGVEVCNGIDDDCNGIIDDGDPCHGGKCENGQCAAPCLAGEFPCPAGKVCDANNFCINDPCFGKTCANDANGNLQTCNSANGSCQPLCETVTCPLGLVCRGTDGACVVDTCDYLPKCTADQICVDSACVANPCNGVTCGDGQFCRAGACVASCEGVSCKENQTCQDGACISTGCSVDCGTGVCNPGTGQCQNSRCVGIVCAQTKECDPVNGSCIADRCQGVTCPTGQTCAAGQCGAPPHGGLVTTGGGGGCSTSGDGSLGLVAFAAALLLGRRLRRVQQTRATGPRGMSSRRPAWSMAALVVAALPVLSLGGGCKINDYCLECETGNGDGGTGDGGTGSGDAGPVVCDPNQVLPELCNGIDDNCNGQIDEGFDLQTDAMNCGRCGNQCSKPGAQTVCVDGACQIAGCFGGFVDVDNDIHGPYASSDGCEYGCFQSNGGVEVCDDFDNNCDGVIDDGFDKKSDPNNCGVCGRICAPFGTTTSRCTNGACAFNPQTECTPGFVDLDGNQANGCEYKCTPTNNGVEKCDLIDNNCDGHVDETFQLATDPLNCGHCGVVCKFSNATPSCAAGACQFNPATDCQPGFVDVNGKQVDGCEYQCTKTNGGIEICDGKDNDCNGIADDNPVDAGLACASTGTPTGACVANGVLTCSAGHLVCRGATDAVPETCNNVDDNCNGTIDDGVTQACYTGAPSTSGIGICHPGTSTCAAGAFGACAGEVLPSTELCNNLDDDCNGSVDDAPGGGAITAACYTGPNGTQNVGTCVPGTKTCAFGTFGACAGQVVPTADVCGDGLDTDCDGKNDAAEGCVALGNEQRLDAAGGTLGDAPGAQHSYDVVLARGGVPLGINVYAAWSQLVTASNQTEVYYRRSTDGGVTWGNIVSVTSGNGNKVKPMLAVAPGAGTTDRIVVVYQTVTGGVRDIRVQISTNGTSFGAASAALDAAGDSFHHVVAISGSNCVVAWEKLDTTTLNRDVQSRTSTDGCATFNTETTINITPAAPATRFAGRPQVGITAAGGFVWAWREQRLNATRDMFAAAAANATAAFTRTAIDTDANNDSDFPVLKVNETNAYLVWQEVSTVASGGADVLYSRSTNSGTGWSTPVIIDDPAVELSSSFTPTLAVDPVAAGTADDVVAIAWEDRRQGTQIFASVSADGGATFSAAQRASSLAGAPITGQTSVPQITAAGSGVLAVVYQNQLPAPATGPVPQPHSFIATSIDRGATWTFSAFQLDTGAGPALAPQVIATSVAGKPAAMAMWADFRTNQINGDIYGAVSH